MAATQRPTSGKQHYDKLLSVQVLEDGFAIIAFHFHQVELEVCLDVSLLAYL